MSAARRIAALAPAALTVIALCFAANTREASSDEPWIDATGLDQFWRIHDLLAADTAPTDEQWEAMFTAPGYAQLDRVERRSAWMKPVFAMAYQPSIRDEQRDWGRLEEYVTTMVLPHLRQVGEHRDELGAFVSQFSGPETLETAIAAAQQWLPEGAADPALAPPAFLVIVDGDGKALGSSIVMDAYGLSCYPEPVHFLAHELHHIFRGPLELVRHEEVEPAHLALITVLTQLEEEGVAEMIDKPAITFGDEPLPERTKRHPMMSMVWSRYQRIADDAPELLRELNNALTTIAQNPINAGPEGERIASLIPPMTRHSLGMFMAHTIEQRLGRDVLIETVGDPFAFALAYAEATYVENNDLTRTPSFSDDAIDLLVHWQEKYIEVPIPEPGARSQQGEDPQP